MIQGPMPGKYGIGPITLDLYLVSSLTLTVIVIVLSMSIHLFRLSVLCHSCI